MRITKEALLKAADRADEWPVGYGLCAYRPETTIAERARACHSDEEIDIRYG